MHLEVFSRQNLEIFQFRDKYSRIIKQRNFVSTQLLVNNLLPVTCSTQYFLQFLLYISIRWTLIFTLLQSSLSHSLIYLFLSVQEEEVSVPVSRHWRGFELQSQMPTLSVCSSFKSLHIIRIVPREHSPYRGR